MIGLSLLSSVSKHNMWSYYDWVVVVFPSVNTICGRIMIGLSLLSFVSKQNTVEFVYNEQVYNEIRLIAK